MTILMRQKTGNHGKEMQWTNNSFHMERERQFLSPGEIGDNHEQTKSNDPQRFWIAENYMTKHMMQKRKIVRLMVEITSDIGRRHYNKYYFLNLKEGSIGHMLW